MTDNEIIKALECCISKGTCDTNCPMWSVQHCGLELRKEALNLINRQKAEIERLTTIVDDGAEVCHNCHSKYAEKIKQAKAEAIKEFAERLQVKVRCSENQGLR